LSEVTLSNFLRGPVFLLFHELFIVFITKKEMLPLCRILVDKLE